MKYRYSVLVAVCLALGVLVSGPARAAMTGNDLLSYCKRSGLFDAGICLGYIGGAWNTMQGYSSYKKIPHSLRICSPEKVTIKQVKDVVVQYLEQNPNLRHVSGGLTIKFALQAAWPCPKK